MKKYKIIYADPPWQYRDKMVMTGVHGLIRGAKSFYKTMSLKDICNLNVQKIANKNSALFLWITVPLLPNGFEVMKRWGYQYKTAIFWRKIMSLGMGHWFRGQVEVCLFGIKGKVKAFRIQKCNFMQCKVGKHSSKPDYMYELIEMSGLKPRIELFARNTDGLFGKRQGWDVWGNEVESDIELLPIDR